MNGLQPHDLLTHQHLLETQQPFWERRTEQNGAAPKNVR